MNLTIINLSGSNHSLELIYQVNSGGVQTVSFNLNSPATNVPHGVANTAYWNNVQSIQSLMINGIIYPRGVSPVGQDWIMVWHLGAHSSVVILMDVGEPLINYRKLTVVNLSQTAHTVALTHLLGGVVQTVNFNLAPPSLAMPYGSVSTAYWYNIPNIQSLEVDNIVYPRGEGPIDLNWKMNWHFGRRSNVVIMTDV